MRRERGKTRLIISRSSNSYSPRWKEKFCNCKYRTSREDRREKERPARYQGSWKENTPTTIFIDNISRDVSEYQLGRLVNRFARWSRIYICRKVRNWTQNAFAFVDVSHVKEAKRVIDGIKGWAINGSKLWARMEFQGHKVREERSRPRSVETSEKLGKARGYKGTKDDGIRKERSSALSRLSINVKVDEEMKSCLEKYVVVATLQEEMSAQDALNLMHRRWSNVSGLLALSRKKFLIVFNSSKEVDDIICKAQEHEDMDIRRWMVHDQIEKRKAWVIIRGIPLHAWNRTNVRKIAQTVGEVIKIEDEDNNAMENAEVRIRVETSSLQMINLKIIVKVEGQRFPVSIVEVEEQSPILKNFDSSKSIIQFTGDKKKNPKNPQNQQSSKNVDQGLLDKGGEQNSHKANDSSSSNNIQSDSQGQEGAASSFEGLENALIQHNDDVGNDVNNDGEGGGRLAVQETIQESPASGENFQVQPHKAIATDEDVFPLTQEFSEVRVAAHVTEVARVSPGASEDDGRTTERGKSAGRASSKAALAPLLMGKSQSVSVAGDRSQFKENTPEKSLIENEGISQVVEILHNTSPASARRKWQRPPVRNDQSKIINVESEAEECIDLLMQLGWQVPNPSLTKSNLIDQIQSQARI